MSLAKLQRRGLFPARTCVLVRYISFLLVLYFYIYHIHIYVYIHTRVYTFMYVYMCIHTQGLHVQHKYICIHAYILNYGYMYGQQDLFDASHKFTQESWSAKLISLIFVSNTVYHDRLATYDHDVRVCRVFVCVRMPTHFNVHAPVPEQANCRLETLRTPSHHPGPVICLLLVS